MFAGQSSHWLLMSLGKRESAAHLITAGFYLGNMGAPGAHALPFSVTVNHMQGGFVVLVLKHSEA